MKKKISILLVLLILILNGSNSWADRDELATKAQMTTQAVGIGAFTKTYELTGENLVALIEQMADFSTKGSAIVFNRWTGQLFIKHPAATQELVSKILADIRRSINRQVEIEARIMTVRDTNFQQAGLDSAGLDFLTTSHKNDRYGTDSNFGDLKYNSFIQFQKLVDGAGNPTGGQLGLMSLSRRFNIASAIDFLKRNTELNTLAAPKISVSNNQRAHLKIAQADYFVRQLKVTSDVNAATVATEMEVDAAQSGTVLDVTPTINRDGTITLELHPQFVTADLSKTQTVNVAGTSILSSSDQPFVRLPVFTNQSIDTTVTVEDGGVLMLGGLINEDETKSLQKVPGLSSIPLIGKLFQNEKTSRAKTHLLIFLQARVIDQKGISK